MTYIDKYIELHPDVDRKAVIARSCPNYEFEIEGEPVCHCTFSDITKGGDECGWCWRRTYRGEEERYHGD